MRIIAIRPLLLSIPLESPLRRNQATLTEHRNLIVLVETSEGLRGSGEIWINQPVGGGAERAFVVNEILAPMLVGETIDDPRRLHRRMVEGTRRLARRWQAPGPISHAISGVDIAIWDAFARRQEQPLRHLLRAGAPDWVAVYASSFGPGPVAEAIETAAAEGHSRFKLRLVRGPECDRRTLEEARAVCGGQSLSADFVETASVGTLHKMWESIQAAQLDWLEEPFPLDDRAAYAAYRALPDRPPLALGENILGLTDSQAMLTDYRPDLVQPDITKAGGISAGQDIGRGIAAAGKRLLPHMLGGPIGFLVTANLAAAIQPDPLVEMDYLRHLSFAIMLGRDPCVQNGAFRLSDRPGHGAEIDEDRLAQWIVS